MSLDFPTRLGAAAAKLQLCVGIDPHPATLAQWELDESLSSLERFCRTMVSALAGRVFVFKPQSAFFEAYGPNGLRALQRVLADIKDAGAVSILDVKRGDIGSTMAAYARAYLSPEAPLGADAITLAPYLGFESLRPAYELAAQFGRGVFVLARTSNPEGDAVQLAAPPAEFTGATQNVAQYVVNSADSANRGMGIPLVGLVIGATHVSAGVDLNDFGGWILAPGIGAQGGKMTDLDRIFGTARPRVIPSVSRQISDRGPSEAGIVQAVAELCSTWASQ